MSTRAQVAPGHLCGLVDAEESEHGGGHVFERATFAKCEPARGFVDEEEGDGVGGVRGVRVARARVDHLLTVAVIRRDDRATARRA